MTRRTTAALLAEVDGFRRQLLAHCYRMTGSPFDAEDAVQETLLRVWRSGNRYDEDLGSIRAWVFAIASRVCLDQLRGESRRARVAELVPAARPGDEVHVQSSYDQWVLPVVDDRVVARDADPALIVEQRVQVRLAFVAALQRLPARQRAALLLRDVLGFSATEVASQLNTTPAAVASALQRARATLSDGTDSSPTGGSENIDEDLLGRYCQAFETHDVAALVTLLHDEVVFEMPPSTWWLSGRAHVAVALEHTMDCRGDLAIPVRLNGSLAFRQVRPRGAGTTTVAFVVLETRDGLVSRITAFLAVGGLEQLLTEAPMNLEPAERRRG